MPTDLRVMPDLNELAKFHEGHAPIIYRGKPPHMIIIGIRWELGA